MRLIKQRKRTATNESDPPFFQKNNKKVFFGGVDEPFFTAPIQAKAMDDEDHQTETASQSTEQIGMATEEESVESGMDSPEKSQSTDDNEVMIVEEDYVPNVAGAVPDEWWYIPTVGVENMVDQNEANSSLVASPGIGFVNKGRTDTARYGDKSSPLSIFPHAFTDGGKTGTVVWGGGGGAGSRGNQAAGSIQLQIPPVFEAKTNSPTDAEAWIRIATGLVGVTRSWVGINLGDQGNGHFVTAGAATRINNHETLHVANSLANYNTHLDPLTTRVGQFFGAILGTQHGVTKAAAIVTLKAFVKWAASITAFQNADKTANQPGGTVDTTDLASGTYPVDAGPGNVGGKAFQHRVRLPGEPNPV